MEQRLYLPQYLLVNRLNWKTFSTPSFCLLLGIHLHRTPGHTDGSIIMEIALPVSGTAVLTGDLFHVKENYEEGRPQGPLMRDFNAWHRSRGFVRELVARTGARVLLGHERGYLEAFRAGREFLE